MQLQAALEQQHLQELQLQKEEEALEAQQREFGQMLQMLQQVGGGGGPNNGAGMAAPGSMGPAAPDAREQKYKSVIELQKALAALQIRARTLSTPDDPMLKMQVRSCFRAIVESHTHES